MYIYIHIEPKKKKKYIYIYTQPNTELFFFEVQIPVNFPCICQIAGVFTVVQTMPANVTFPSQQHFIKETSIGKKMNAEM